MIPEILVIPHLYVKGWTGAPVTGTTGSEWFIGTKSVPLCEKMSLLTALETNFKGADTCMVGYAPVAEDVYPRMLKPALVRFAANDPTAPQLTTLLIDIDHENHTPPPPEWAEAQVALLDETWKAACSWYRTPNGMRLVFVPKEPVPLRYADSYINQAHRILQDFGIKTDDGTSDWTRLQRMPRAGGRTYPMDLTALREGRVHTWHPVMTEVDEAAPKSIGHAVNRTEASAQAHVREFKLTKDMLRQLSKVDPELADNIYHGTFHAEVGDRHKLLLAAAMTIVTVYETIDPLVPFRMLHDAALRLEKNATEVWNLCIWACSAFDGIKKAEKDERATAEQRAAKLMGVSPSQVASHLIIDLGAEQFVWDEGRGTYTSGCTHQHQVLTAVDKHCQVLTEDWFSSFSEVMRAHSTKAKRLVYTYTPDQAGFDANTETMYIPVCQPDRALTPKFNADVQGWLEALFNKGTSPYYESVMDWLAALPQLDMPVCALYIDGPRSVGKGLLTYGIARLWSKECRVMPYSELLNDFNESLTQTPLIYADEKVPSGKQQDSSVFRQMVGNSSMRINIKYRSVAIIEGYPRIIITANNAEALTFKEDLTMSDIDALRLRLGYVEVGPEGEEYLKRTAEAQGFPSARHMADGWKADGLIAQHILWLAQNRDFTPGSRFLVEGWDSPLIRHMPTNVGSAGLIVDAVVAAMTSTKRKVWESVRWVDGHIYVNNQILADEWDELCRGERMPLSNGRMKALKSMSGGNSRRFDITTGGGQRSQRHYWAIPADVIAQVADDRKLADRLFILELAARTDEGVYINQEEDHEVLFGL
jgi:hypothetical protein